MSLPTLLALPTELRLKIYEFLFDAHVVGNKLLWNDRFKLSIHGNKDDQTKPRIRISGSPFTLVRVCRELSNEVAPLLPKLEDVELHFSDLTQSQAQVWMQSISAEQVTRIRRIKITGWDKCYLRRPMYTDGHRYNCQFGVAEVCTKGCNALTTDENEIRARLGLCGRSLRVDLTVLERDFNADSWYRLLGADHRVQSISNGFVGEPTYGREYYRGYYLLRMLDGCVDIDEPKAHPERFSNQCNSIVDIQQSLADLVGHDGKLNVTKEAILGLMESVLGDGFQGGSSERYLRLVTNRLPLR